MSFDSDMRRIAKKIGAEAEQLGRAVKIELFSATIDDTRVDTGLLKGNWQTSEEAPAQGVIERLDPSGSQAKGEVTGTVKGASVSYLVNNLPYAQVWEERDAMVARNVIRIERIIKEKARQ